MPKKKAASNKSTAKRPSAKGKTASKSARQSGKTSSKRKDIGKKVTGNKSASRKKATAGKSSKKSSPKRATSAKKSTRPVAVARPVRKPAAGKSSASAPLARSGKAAARRGAVLAGPVPGFDPYQPKRGEAYMSDEQLEHFRQILLAWKRELMEEVDRTMHHMKDDASNPPDPNDRATQETEFGLELRTRDRERKLLKKIESALDRIDSGTYGYCEETGDEIGLRRLEARPVATLCVEAQERRELAEKQFTDREDYYR